MGRNKMAMKTQPCQYRREPAGMKKSTATKMTAKRLRRRRRVLRLREVVIDFDVTENDKERVAERMGWEGRSPRTRYARSDQRARWTLLKSRRNGGGRTVAVWRGTRRRGIGAALPAGEGAAAPGAGAWSWGRNESPIYGEAGGRIGWRGRGDAAIPVSVYGGTAAGSRPARGADGHGSGCGASGRGGSSGLAVVGGRQVHGRTNDFAGSRTACAGWSARIGVLWLS